MHSWTVDRMQDRMVLRIGFINRSKIRYFLVISKQCGQISITLFKFSTIMSWYAKRKCDNLYMHCRHCSIKAWPKVTIMVKNKDCKFISLKSKSRVLITSWKKKHELGSLKTYISPNHINYLVIHRHTLARTYTNKCKHMHKNYFIHTH